MLPTFHMVSFYCNSLWISRVLLQSPERQPTISLHLPVCTDCKVYISSKQHTDTLWYTDPEPTSPIEIFVAMDTTFRSLRDEVAADIATVSTVSYDINENRQTENIPANKRLQEMATDDKHLK